MSSSHASKHIKEWLPMPSGLSFTDNSFSADLLKQFDKRRSQLNSDEISIEQHQQQQQQQQDSIHSFASSIHSIPKQVDSSSIRRSSSSSLNNRFHHNTQQIEQPRAAAIFNSWTLKKKKKFHNRHVQEMFDEPLSKIAINTTISISPNINNQYTDNMIQPPIITQYPPKPLKYSPVEPLPAEAYAGSDQHNNTSNRNTLKRLSLPLLKLTAASQAATSGNTLHRRRSDSDLLNQPTNQPNHTFFRSLSKRWNKLLTTCKSKRIKNKRNGAA